MSRPATIYAIWLFLLVWPYILGATPPSEPVATTPHLEGVTLERSAARSNLVARTFDDPVALFTLLLVASTLLLWNETRKSAEITRIAAEAARESADAAVKAAMPILLPLIVDSSELLPPNNVPVDVFAPSLSFVFENFGKTPGIIVALKFKIDTAFSIPSSPSWDYHEVRDERLVIPGETRFNVQDTTARIFRSEMWRDVARAEIALLRANITSETPDPLRFFFFGEVTYDDVFGYRHIRGFARRVLRVDLGQTPPQYVKGGEEFEYYKRINRKTWLEG